MTDMTVIEQTARKYIQGLVLTSDPLMPKWNRENFIFRKQPKWNYMDACMIRGLLMYGGEENIAYARSFIDSYVNEDGSISTMEPSDHNLDSICGGMDLIELYRMTGCERYRLGYEWIYRMQLEKQPRLSCGSYWHKEIYPCQLWLDGAYMALPFLASYGRLTDQPQLVEDALSQLSNIRRIMRDDKTGLYYHGYSEREIFWADSETGLSREFWLRSNGWLCAGLADICEITGDSLAGEMLRGLVDSLSRYLTDEGMLLQLPVRNELEKNYPETSGTLLFAYGAMKGSRLGVLDASAGVRGISALSAVTENYIDNTGDIPVLKNICLMGGLGGAEHRDGSAGYYLSERIVENEAKGIAPYLMAAAEYIRKKEKI